MLKKLLKIVCLFFIIGPLFVLSTSFTIVKMTPPPPAPPLPDNSLNPLTASYICDTPNKVGEDIKSKKFRPLVITGSKDGYAVIVWQNMKTDETIYVVQNQMRACIMAVGNFSIYQPPSGINKI